VERAHAQRPRDADGLALVDDVVDLAVLLRAADARERRGQPVVVEALEVALVQVDAGLAVHHEVGERLARAAAVGDPDRLREPQPADPAGLAQQRRSVRREGHEAVERAGQRRAAQGGEQAPGLLAGGGEVLGRELALGGMQPGPGGADPVRRDHERLVQVGADAVRLAGLAQVHRVVLVAQDRMVDLARRSAQLGQRLGQRVEVLDRVQGEPQAGEPQDPWPPDPGGEHHVIGLDRAPRGLHAAHAAALGAQAGHLAPPERPDAGLPAQRLRRAQRLADAVVGDVQAAQDALRVDERQPPRDLLRAQQLRLQAEGEAAPVAALQLLPALPGGGDLDAAHRVVAGQPVELERRVQRDRAPRETCHRRRRVDLEHEAGGVRGRPAGLPERPLLDDDDVAPAPACQVICQTCAGDAGPHHDDASAAR
jgi:hypothetical protein